MTSILRHPSTDLLLDYSAGVLSPSHAVCIATHLEFCSACRNAHQRNNAIGGKLIDELDPSGKAEVSASLKEKVLTTLDKSPKASEPEQKREDCIPRVLRQLVPKGLAGLNWRRVSIKGTRCRLARDDNGNNIFLLRLKAGGRLARHRHLGNEYTVVLAGSFSDEDGVYQIGDFLVRNPDESHSLTAPRDAECICLLMQEGPPQFTSWLLKWLNPFLRVQAQAG